ncbi:hypothetical protein MLPF_2823 [Mycobacterium lepromatosis]|nr:hypothetical protein MLPF_2823 [Mycobacterium lepromatosis]
MMLSNTEVILYTIVADDRGFRCHTKILVNWLVG